MFNMPLVSFVVTSYNYEKFIEQTLDSIVNQSYKNYEIIVVDDCSSDNSVSVIERFIAINQDKRITLITHSKNKGQLASMLDGLHIAQGEFVSFVDSDDVIVKEYTKAHLRVHMAECVAFTSSQVIEIDENNTIHTTHSIYSPQENANKEPSELENILDVDIDNLNYKILKNKRFGGWFWSPNSSAMFRKSAIDIVLKYKGVDKWKICPDKFLFNFANLIGGSAIIYAPLVGYRRHQSNAGCGNYICGNSKYPSDKTSLNNLRNNLKIRPETLKFLIANKKDFVEKFGSRGYMKFLFRVIL